MSSASSEEAPERVLCFNVLLDESHRDVQIHRHPLYAFSEALSWPPENWEEICCWHCCHRCSQEPVPLPQTRDRRTGTFAVFGVFCSWPCAKQYLNEHQTWGSGERTLLLEEMARCAFGYEGPPILAAPARHRLKMFGGDLSIEDFREEHKHLNATLRPPLTSFPEVYERCCTLGDKPAETPTDAPAMQWSVRGLRPRPGTAGAATAAAAEQAKILSPSPFDAFVRARGTAPGGGVARVGTPMMTRPLERMSQMTPTPPPGTVVPGTLSVFMKKRR